MDHVEQEEIETYRPRSNAHIGNPLGAEENYGLFSVKNDKSNPILTDDYGYDADYEIPNYEVHRRWTEQNRDCAMREFGVTEWEPDLTF